MIKSILEKMAEDIGYEIGASDDETQAKLLNGFSKALLHSMTPSQLDMQILYIKEKLSPDSITVIKLIKGFIDYEENKHTISP